MHALRFYEREGILAHPVQRESNGRRVYSESDVEWLILCTCLRASGMPLTAIKQYAEMVRQGAGNEKERLELLREHRERVLGQLPSCRITSAWWTGRSGGTRRRSPTAGPIRCCGDLAR